MERIGDKECKGKTFAIERFRPGATNFRTGTSQTQRHNSAGAILFVKNFSTTAKRVKIKTQPRRNRILRIAVIDTRSFQEVKYMCYSGLLKRFVPFALTFAAGLFIASFFVSIALPEAGWRSRRGFNKFQEIQRLQTENQQLRDQLRLERIQNEEMRRARGNENLDFVIPDAVPPVQLDELHPPPPPKRPKQPRFE